MSRIYQLRKAVKDILVAAQLWPADQIIIRRRGQIWNDVATAIAASKDGSCIVIGVAKGDGDKSRQPRSKQVIMDVTVPVTIVETPQTDPDAEESAEDDRWEKTVTLLQGNDLGRPGKGHDFAFESFDEVESKEYLIRQTVFKTRLVLTASNT